MVFFFFQLNDPEGGHLCPLSMKAGAGLPVPSEESGEALLSFPLLLTWAGATSELGLPTYFSVTLDKNNALSA